jgi:integrase
VCIALAAFAGLRAGEIAGLQLGDIEFLHRRIQVHRQNTADGPKPPKYGSERPIYAPAALMDRLSAQVARRGISDPSDWVFVGQNGQPMHQNQLTQRWCYFRNQADLKGLRLHDCRHHFASGLIAAGCDVVTVSRALGHSNPAITLKIYAHLWPSAEDRTRQAAASIMAAALDPVADSVRTGEGG